MLCTAPLTSADLYATSLRYVECDVPEGQTLVDWRRERDAARRAAQQPPRRFRFARREPMGRAS